jgi:GcrA cell cycle regulator
MSFDSPLKSPLEWTDDQVALLRDKAAAGLPASQIAAVLGHGVTKGAVRAKASRIGVKLSAKPPPWQGWPHGGHPSFKDNPQHSRVLNRGAVGSHDGRSREGRFLRKMEDELTAQCNGQPTFVQKLAITDLCDCGQGVGPCDANLTLGNPARRSIDSRNG